MPEEERGRRNTDTPQSVGSLPPQEDLAFFGCPASIGDNLESLSNVLANIVPEPIYRGFPCYEHHLSMRGQEPAISSVGLAKPAASSISGHGPSHLATYRKPCFAVPFPPRPEEQDRGPFHPPSIRKNSLKLLATEAPRPLRNALSRHLASSLSLHREAFPPLSSSPL